MIFEDESKPAIAIIDAHDSRIPYFLQSKDHCIGAWFYFSQELNVFHSSMYGESIDIEFLWAFSPNQIRECQSDWSAAIEKSPNRFFAVSNLDTLKNYIRAQEL